MGNVYTLVVIELSLVAHRRIRFLERLRFVTLWQERNAVKIRQ